MNTTMAKGGWKKQTQREKNDDVYLGTVCTSCVWGVRLLLLWTNRQTNRLHIVFWREWIGKVVGDCSVVYIHRGIIILTFVRGLFATFWRNYYFCKNIKSRYALAMHKTICNDVNYCTQTLRTSTHSRLNSYTWDANISFDKSSAEFIYRFYWKSI